MGRLIGYAKRVVGSVEDDPGSPYFATDFDFEAERDDPDKDVIFQANGFQSFKDEMTNPGGGPGSGTGPAGFMSTTTTIHGHPGAVIPCDSGRILKMESLPQVYDSQGDTYFEIDPSGTSAIDSFPPEQWWEWWIWPNRIGDEMSLFEEAKFWYWLEACDDPVGYPNQSFADVCRPNIRVHLHDVITGDTHQDGYEDGAYTFEILGAKLSPSEERLRVHAQWSVGDPGAAVRGTPNIQDGVREWIKPNEWTKVRMQKSIGQSPARFRMWTRGLYEGDENFHLVWDTALPGYCDFTTYPVDQTGSRKVRCWTTSGPTDASGSNWWQYMARPRFATSQAGLGVQRRF